MDTDGIRNIQECLVLPKDILNFSINEVTNEYEVKIRRGLVADSSMLTCGCCISESLYLKLQTLIDGGPMRCPNCQVAGVSIVGAVEPLRNIFSVLQAYGIDSNSYRELSSTDYNFGRSEKTITSDSNVIVQKPETVGVSGEEEEEKSSEYIPNRSEYFDRAPNKQQHSLLSLFHEIATRVTNESMGNSSVTDTVDRPSIDVTTTENDNYETSSTEDWKLFDNASNVRTVPVSQDSFTMGPIKNDLQKLSVSANTSEEKEYYFAKCFPVCRRRTQFSTHQKFLRTKSKLFVNMDISPDCTKFALITERRWEVYNIPNDISKENPSLICCGKSSGEYGPDFDNLLYPRDRHVLIPRGETSVSSSWEHYYCKLSDDFLVISGAKRKLRIFDLNQGGQPVYTHLSNFPIRCIDIDPNSNLLACGITGKDRHTGSEQALIAFHRIIRNKVTSEPEFLSPFTITLPYRDPINTMQFSNDGLYLSCSTALESRFLVISLRKINEPRLVMKSLRSIDTSLESEGITDTKLFPGNPNLMCVTSMAFNSPPIIINTRIQSMEGLQHVAQPTMLMRLDELGSKIHRCEVSPRNDSIAFLERNGSVYIMFAPTMMDNEKRRIVLVDIVANAYRAQESAALRFTPNGHKLLILDRKGILYIEDFSYGLPQSHEVTKCKLIN